MYMTKRIREEDGGVFGFRRNEVKFLFYERERKRKFSKCLGKLCVYEASTL
jgi:hypothetical protein